MPPGGRRAGPAARDRGPRAPAAEGCVPPPGGTCRPPSGASTLAGPGRPAPVGIRCRHGCRRGDAGGGVVARPGPSASATRPGGYRAPLEAVPGCRCRRPARSGARTAGIVSAGRRSSRVSSTRSSGSRRTGRGAAVPADQRPRFAERPLRPGRRVPGERTGSCSHPRPGHARPRIPGRGEMGGRCLGHVSRLETLPVTGPCRRRGGNGAASASGNRVVQGATGAILPGPETGGAGSGPLH